MFGFGPFEIGIIVLVILAFAGPTLLPRLGKTLGASLRSVRSGATDLTDQLIEGMEQSKLPPPSGHQNPKDDKTS